MKLLYCLCFVLLGVSLTYIPALKNVNGRVLSVIGWAVALFFAKGGN